MMGLIDRVRNWAGGGSRPARVVVRSPKRSAKGETIIDDPYDGDVWRHTELAPRECVVNPPWMPGVELTDPELDGLFFQSLLEPPDSIPREDAHPAVWERRLMECARDAQRATQRLPRVPTVVPSLLRLLRDEGVSVAELATLVEHDIVLVAELLGEVNVAANGLKRPVTQAADAIALLGRHRLRMLIARVAFRPVLSADKGWLTRRAAPRMQMQFELSAHACHLMTASEENSADESDVVLGGLTQNAGWMLLFHLLDSQDPISNLPTSPIFWQHLSGAAHNLSQRIAEQWGFPPHVVHGLADMARGETKLSPMADMLHRVDRIVKLRILADSGDWVCPSPRARTCWPKGEQACFEQLSSLANTPNN